jgi:hypothetical protein
VNKNGQTSQSDNGNNDNNQGSYLQFHKLNYPAFVARSFSCAPSPATNRVHAQPGG